ncbi:MAG TPA: O-antigen ligase family protein [Solirubrobacteraceae bacterium]
MMRWPLVSLRETPVAIPALAAIALFVVWATSQAGYPLTHWAPGALIVLALLAIALLAVPLHLAEIPLPVKLALACLAAYAALSFLSILWASAPGEAWEGANRTLLYLMVFALFALWRGRGASASLMLSLWTLALIGLVVYVAVHFDTVTGRSFDAMLTGERLIYPVGYANANAAQWLMAFWPALLLARGGSLPWALRGVLAGGAVLLADVALLSLSRGSLYATPVMIALVFGFVPERLRTFVTAVPIALGIGLTAPLVLRVGDRIEAAQSPHAAIHTAVIAMFVASLLVGLVVAAGSRVESRVALSPLRARTVRRGVGALAITTLIVILAGGLVAAGNPVVRVRHGWDTFKSGYAADNSTGNRLLSGLGSERYDFYRVALDEFVAHPALGIGADNFSQQYLAHGRSDETPRYPHSVELRTLVQTGLLGALLAVVGLAAALLAGWRAMRARADPLARTVAAAALAGFAYWTVHGSFDWFWEFAGLGASAFALLGIACSLAPARGPDALMASAGGAGEISAGGRSLGRRPVARILLSTLAGLLALAAIASLVAPWLSERQIQSAASTWPKAPLAAYARLDDAAKLNPLSDRAYLVEGSIALRFGDFSRAERAFSRALERVPDDAYAALELGAIASESGARTRALGLLERAVHLNPRDPLTRQALETVRSGKRVGVEGLNRAILVEAEHLS